MSLEHAASQALDLLTSLEAFEVTPELQGRIRPTVEMLSDSLQRRRVLLPGRADHRERLHHLIKSVQLLTEHPQYQEYPAMQHIYHLLWLAEEELVELG